MRWEGGIAEACGHCGGGISFRQIMGGDREGNGRGGLLPADLLSIP